jgi:prolyl oligopeptidase
MEELDDDRVVPMHSLKLAATLQHSLPDNPHLLLLLVDKKAGHKLKSTQQRSVIVLHTNNFCFLFLTYRMRENADKWGFVVQSLGLAWKDLSATKQQY